MQSNSFVLGLACVCALVLLLSLALDFELDVLKMTALFLSGFVFFLLIRKKKINLLSSK